MGDEVGKMMIEECRVYFGLIVGMGESYVNTLKTTELYSFNGWIVRHMNYISIKPFNKEKSLQVWEVAYC